MPKHTQPSEPTPHTLLSTASTSLLRCLERYGPGQRKPTYGQCNSIIEELDVARRAMVILRDGNEEAPR